MTLAEYLRLHREKKGAFAKRAEIHPSTLSRILSGKLFPRIPLMNHIKILTGNEVTEKDWNKRIDMPERKRRDNITYRVMPY